jgi:hypothetical protein
MAGDILESQARIQGRFASWLLLVLAIVFVTWFVVFSVIGLFLPLISLVSALSG